MKSTKFSIMRIMALAMGMMLCCSLALAAEPAPGVQVLKFDRVAGVADMPDNFRTMQSEFKRAKGDAYPSRAGLDKLRVSGSSSFAKNEFRKMLPKIPAAAKDIIVLDLRDESHGYINEHEVSWYSRYKTYNKGLDAASVEQRETALLHQAKAAGQVAIATQAKDKSSVMETPIQVASVMTEKEFVEAQGAGYYRIPMMDYSAPTRANIDQFVAFYKQLPPTAWIHAHCEAGVGRTTIMLSMLDMIHNAGQLSYDEIMTREVLLGGQDVRESAAGTKDAYKKANYPKRALFTQHFYDYVKAHPQLDITWSTWCDRQGYDY
jgi:hypothetical protein